MIVKERGKKEGRSQRNVDHQQTRHSAGKIPQPIQGENYKVNKRLVFPVESVLDCSKIGRNDSIS